MHRDRQRASGGKSERNIRSSNQNGADVINRREFVAGAGAVFAGSLAGNPSRLFAAETEAAQITIDLGSKTTSLPHFWEKPAGSDRTVVGLLEQWRHGLVR